MLDEASRGRLGCHDHNQYCPIIKNYGKYSLYKCSKILFFPFLFLKYYYYCLLIHCNPYPAQITHRLDTHPCIVTVTEMGAARHFLRTTLADKSNEERLKILQPTLEINPQHNIIAKLAQLKNNNPDLARLVIEQVTGISQEGYLLESWEGVGGWGVVP